VEQQDIQGSQGALTVAFETLSNKHCTVHLNRGSDVKSTSLGWEESSKHL